MSQSQEKSTQSSSLSVMSVIQTDTQTFKENFDMIDNILSSYQNLNCNNISKFLNKQTQALKRNFFSN